ncbi:MAG TPA: peptidase M28 family protein [Phaeodactylibacter sp.]|nr:peptidase M28 family protein [Phaeodactylibacter sp.]
MKKRYLLYLLFLFFFQKNFFAQSVPNSDEDAFFIKKIYNASLTQGQCYPWLTHLTQIGGRLAGSPQAAAAVEYTRQMLDSMGLDSVWLQPCMVPHWVRGEKEQVRIINSPTMGSLDLKALALGNSVGTGIDGVSAEVIEVQSREEVEQLGAAKIKGKIVFYNRPMDPTQIRTFRAYGGAVAQRTRGASTAAEYGAVAVLVRSMTTRLDDIPHTGTLVYKDGVKKIPAVAISTNDAELLSRLLKKEKTSVFVKTMCETLPDVLSYNVIGEVRGTEFPEEIILVGGHLDAWDVGEGAHDDGAGCVQSMDVLQILKRLNYRPKRTLRCVLFMNEENGLAGGKAYAKASNQKGEFHLACIESDAGGFTPRGFATDGHESIFTKKFKTIIEWLPLLEPYGLQFQKGGSGADISPLKSQKGLLIGFRPDSQRYFDYHHTAIDTLEAVNKRELELGVASITSLVFLIDKYGL